MLKIIILCGMLMPAFTEKTVYAQTQILIKPEKTLVPAALANTNEGFPNFFTSDDGSYAVAYTKREAKAWKLPEGELVFRYQAGMDDPRPGKDFYSHFVRKVTITADGKYIYVSGAAWINEVVVAVELETGEFLPDGLVMDSLKSGAYQMKRGARNFNEIEWNFRTSVLTSKGSPLAVKRNYEVIDKLLYEEDIRMVGMAPAKMHPGEVIICYRQGYCRSGKWLRDAAEKTHTSVREVEKNRTKGHCQFFDLHAARLNPSTKQVNYLGPVLKGVERVDYHNIRELYPSPYADVVGVQFDDTYDTIHFYNFSGQHLWSTPTAIESKFDKYDAEGNVMIYEKDKGGKKFITTRKPLSGVVVNRYRMPEENFGQTFLDNWGMTANLTKGDDGNYTLSLHNAFDGKMLMALTDDEAAAKFSNTYRAAVAKAEADKQERIRQNAQWRANWEERKKLEREKAIAAETEHYAKNKTASDQHDQNYKQCPACSGTGGEYVQETYTESKTTTLWGGPRVGAAGYQTTTKTYNTPYKKFIQCSKCWGKGEVKK